MHTHTQIVIIKNACVAAVENLSMTYSRIKRTVLKKVFVFDEKTAFIIAKINKKIHIKIKKYIKNKHNFVIFLHFISMLTKKFAYDKLFYTGCYSVK